MPQPDHELVRASLRDALSDEQVTSLNPRSGTLESREELFTDAAAALQDFSRAGGDGWLQDAMHAAILHTASDKAAVELRERLVTPDTWPVTGEFADATGATSGHLRRTSTGWVLTCLTEAPATKPDHLLVTRRLLGGDLQHYLVYHVAYRAEPVGTHEELRPFACRFVKFERVSQAEKPAATPAAEPSAA